MPPRSYIRYYEREIARYYKGTDIICIGYLAFYVIVVIGVFVAGFLGLLLAPSTIDCVMPVFK